VLTGVAASADVDESDAAQLWSTAYPAVRPAVVAVGATAGAARDTRVLYPAEAAVSSADQCSKIEDVTS